MRENATPENEGMLEVHMLISLQGYQQPTTKFSQTGSHSRHFYNQLILLWHSGPYRKSATAGLSCFNGMTSSAVARGYDVVLGACLSLTVGLAPVRSESLFDYG